MKNRNFTNFNEFLNIRYIRRVDSIYMDPSDFDYMIERFKKISEENTKLKAEIEQLKLYATEIINARNLSEETAVSIRVRMQREMILQRENEILKERLEIKDNNFELYSNALEEIKQLKSAGKYMLDVQKNLLTESNERILENGKLKEEVKRLNGKAEMYRDMADCFCDYNIELIDEIEQLKSELEQSKAIIYAYEVKKDFKEFCERKERQEAELKLMKLKGEKE